MIDRVARLCMSPADERTLRSQLLAEIGRVIGFDAYAWLLTDPETSVGSAPLADVPCFAELPRLIRLKYATPVNRWTGLPPDGVASLAAATAGDPARSRLWHELLQGYQVGDIASLVFRDRYGCWGFLDLWRVGATAPPFTAEDLQLLAGIVPAVTTGLRRAEAATFAGAVGQAPPGPVVLLLSSELSLLAQTPQTDAYLRELVPPEGDASPVPAGAFNVAAQLLAVEEGVDRNRPLARVHLPTGHWLSMRAARMTDSAAEPRATIAVTIEPASTVERLGLYRRACALTPREAELVRHLAAGRDTREVARRMTLSQHTVQDHLKSVFAKTATHSRRELLAHALGH